MLIEARIKASEIFSGIKELTANPEKESKKVIGFLVAPAEGSRSPSVVKANGETLGEYCCEECAVKAAFLDAYDLQASDPEPDTGLRIPAALMILAMMAARSTRH
ncbi:hypothetical protein ERD95_08215 [Enterobacteriaceae bacterium ML5]|nr:hypothetical protein ERD95_08215 [Enterobacteriaceae bacterium ML5]